MIPCKHVLLPLSLLALAAPVAPRGESLRFAPAEGTVLDRTWELRGEYHTALVEIDVAGMQVEVPDIEIGTTWTRRLEVSDELEEMRAGAPAVLVRRFESIEHELEYAIEVEGTQISHREEGQPDCSSELDGLGVRFEWDPEAEVYAKTLVDDEGDPDLLAGLVEDMDLRGLLPRREVEVGDGWDVDPAAFLRALAPGGDLRVVLGRGDVDRASEVSAAGIDPRMAGSLDVMLGDPTDRSDVSARLEEVREVEGRRVAVVAIEAELVTTASAFELYELWMRDYDPDDEEVAIELERADITFECALEGQLHWDLGANHARSLTLEGDSMLTLTRAINADVGGEPVSVDAEYELEGELSIEARFE